MTIDLTKISADVAALEAQLATNNALLASLSAEIKAISSGSTDAATQSALDALAARIETATSGVAAADAANPATA